jgi:hypothetical protein
VCWIKLAAFVIGLGVLIASSAAYAALPKQSYPDHKLSFADSKIKPIEHLITQANNQKPKWMTQSQLLKQFKKRKPKTKVLKIRFDERKGIYHLKVLTPAGKVKRIQVDARV